MTRVDTLRRALIFTLKLLVSAALLWLVLRNTDLARNTWTSRPGG